MKDEYLTSLREFYQLTGKNEQNIKVGDVVLVPDDTPRVTWKMAVIEELFKGNDGLVRVANIRTVGGRTNRPITRLVPLEVPSAMKNTSWTRSPISTTTTSWRTKCEDH